MISQETGLRAVFVRVHVSLDKGNHCKWTVDDSMTL